MPRKKKDHNKLLRSRIPQDWVDTCDLIPIVNYILVENFFINEFQPRRKEWENSPTLKSFSKWLTRFYHFIKIDKPRLEKQILNSIPDAPLNDWLVKTNQPNNGWYRLKSCKEIYGQSYSKAFHKSQQLEKKLRKMETKLLKELIEYRSFFWT
jgi:hypothetical protein